MLRELGLEIDDLTLEVGDLVLECLDLGQQGAHDRAHAGWGGVPLRRIDPERRHLVAHRASMKQQQRVVKLDDQSRLNR